MAWGSRSGLFHLRGKQNEQARLGCCWLLANRCGRQGAGPLIAQASHIQEQRETNHYSVFPHH